MDSLYPFDHLYISQVKLSSFLYPLSIMTKRGRNCEEYVVSFWRFYILWGEIHASIRGRCVSSCQGECLPPYSCTLGLVTIIGIHCTYLLYMLMYIFFTYLYMCCFFSLFIHMFLYLYAIYYFYFTQKCLDEFCLKCFKNTCCQSLLAINSLLKKFFKSLC